MKLLISFILSFAILLLTGCIMGWGPYAPTSADYAIVRVPKAEIYSWDYVSGNYETIFINKVDGMGLRAYATGSLKLCPGYHVLDIYCTKSIPGYSAENGKNKLRIYVEAGHTYTLVSHIRNLRNVTYNYDKKCYATMEDITEELASRHGYN